MLSERFPCFPLDGGVVRAGGASSLTRCSQDHPECHPLPRRWDLPYLQRLGQRVAYVAAHWVGRTMKHSPNDRFTQSGVSDLWGAAFG